MSVNSQTGGKYVAIPCMIWSKRFTFLKRCLHIHIQVAFNHLPMSAVLSLVPLLRVFPTVHNVLCACTGVRINEVLRVAHLKVSETYGLYATIRHPHIRHDDRAWQNRLLDDRQPDRSGTVNIKSPPMGGGTVNKSGGGIL